MPLAYDHLMSLTLRDRPFSYCERDTMLYGLSIGMGRDPLDKAELPFVYEGAGLRAVPTMAVVLASTGIIRQTWVDFSRVLHGEQRLTLHRPLPASGAILADSRVVEAYDKGPERGAVLLLETRARDAGDGADLFTFVMTIMARGDGGFGGASGAGPDPHPVPDRAPDHAVALATRPDAALLYRLNGDRNPLHADPDIARRAGFDRPVLHGLCTYGIACRAVLKAVAGHDPAAIRAFDARFSSPVFPGDEIVTDIWRDGPVVSFRCRVPERGAVVLNNGRCLLAEEAFA